MHPVKTSGKRKKSVLIVILALGMGMPSPAQAYLLDFTVASINPGVLISYAGGFPSGPPQVASNSKASDAGLEGDFGGQLSRTIPPPHKMFHTPTGPLGDYLSPVPAAASVWRLGATPQDSRTLQSGISCLTMSGETTIETGSFGTASLTGPADIRGNSFFSGDGFEPRANKNVTLLASLALHRQSANDTFETGFAASFASAPGASTGAMVPSGTIFTHLASFSSSLLLLGCGLIGLAGLRYRRRRG